MYPTKRQKEVLEQIRSFIAEKGYAPSLQEIARRCGLSSVATVHKHLSLLQERGLLKREKSRRRGIELQPLPPSHFAVEVPLLGTIAAGRPIEAIPDPQQVQLPRDLVGRGRTYVLKVAGDSMRDEQIRDGDYIVVEERQEARDGEVVVALIDGREATLKTLHRERGRIRLQPANPSMKPIYVRPGDLRIQGVVTGVIRRYA
ncbi:MAG TPA: transcriptional repressor LexA [Candidatus Polarisedimenticolia bacterium]|nr:transcriptional repressor LexA [Candidatus Polarisedimenticolia bacterium]